MARSQADPEKRGARRADAGARRAKKRTWGALKGGWVSHDTRDEVVDFVGRWSRKAEIAGELPQMAARDQMRNEAREEATLSGQLRRAVHASELSLSAIAGGAATTPLQLDEFLTGERTLRSDVIDRLAHVLGCQLSQVR